MYTARAEGRDGIDVRRDRERHRSDDRVIAAFVIRCDRAGSTVRIGNSVRGVSACELGFCRCECPRFAAAAAAALALVLVFVAAAADQP